MRARRTFALAGLILMLPALFAAKEPEPAAPVLERAPGQDALDARWASYQQLHLGETVYRAGGTRFQDGVCSWAFDEGVFVPVYSGTGQDDRMAGVVFVGKGSVSLDFPGTGEEELFAAHLSRETKVVPPPGAYTTPVESGLLLGFDHRIEEQLLWGQEPVGAGVVLGPGDADVDMEYIITDSRGRMKARAEAAKLLPTRRALMIKGGMDPVAMIAMDRLREETGTPNRELGLIGDFLTATRFGVASGGDNRAAGKDDDSWLTCRRDGGGLAGIGVRAEAFSHGVDGDGNYHRLRFASEAFPPGDDPYLPSDDPNDTLRFTDQDPQLDGRNAISWTDLDEMVMETLPEGTQVLEGGEEKQSFSLDFSKVAGPPPVPIRSRKAFFSLVVDPRKRRTFMHATFQGRLQFEAVRDGVGVILLQVPKDEAVDDSFVLTRLGVHGGPALPFLPVDTEDFDERLLQGGPAGGEGMSAEVSDASSDGSGDGSSIAESTAAGKAAAQGKAVAKDLYPPVRATYRIAVVLPEPLKKGESIELDYNFEADWLFARLAQTDAGYVSLGPGTGFRQLFPSILPQVGADLWDFEGVVEAPGSRNLRVAVSGDTKDEYQSDEDLWFRIQVAGKQGRRPGVAIGPWITAMDPARLGMPAVRVGLYALDAYALEQFPPEVRRVISFYLRLLPHIAASEWELYQAPDAAAVQLEPPGFGLIEIAQIQGAEGTGSQREIVRQLDPHPSHMIVSRQVALQYWTQLLAPANPQSAWVGRALAELYANSYVRGVFGMEDWYTQMLATRKVLEDKAERENVLGIPRTDDPVFSLSGDGTMLRYSPRAERLYASYVFGWMLPMWIGQRNVFAAMDELARNRAGRTYTVEHVQAALEQVSGSDLDIFFESWVRMGVLPNLRAEVKRENGGHDLVGCLVSDIPRGRMQVPLQIIEEDGGGAQGIVTIVDGKGAFEFRNRRSPKPSLLVDREGLVLALSRDVVETEEPSCLP